MLVVEFKKATTFDATECDRTRVLEVRDELHCEFGAFTERETRRLGNIGARIVEWFVE